MDVPQGLLLPDLVRVIGLSNIRTITSDRRVNLHIEDGFGAQGRFLLNASLPKIPAYCIRGLNHCTFTSTEAYCILLADNHVNQEEGTRATFQACCPAVAVYSGQLLQGTTSTILASRLMLIFYTNNDASARSILPSY